MDLENFHDLLYDFEMQLANCHHLPPKIDLNLVIAEEFTEFGTSGMIYTKEDTIKALCIPSLVEISFKDFKAVELIEGIVHVTYISDRYDKSRGSIQHSLRSSIWKFIDERWQIMFHQGTRIG